MAVLAGIDGCRAGWLCLTKDTRSGRCDAHLLAAIDQLASWMPLPEWAMIDIPIGLPDHGSRDCDRAARQLLKAPRASSVFPTPVRPILGAAGYTEACEIGVQTDGRRLSRQTWAILSKIREVDAFVRAARSAKHWLLEVHPEVSFWAWNGERAMAHGKKRPEGRSEREALVQDHYGPALDAARAQLPRGQYANDDLLDAFAALWTAERHRAGQSVCLGQPTGLDSCGLRMTMVA